MFHSHTGLSIGGLKDPKIIKLQPQLVSREIFTVGSQSDCIAKVMGSSSRGGGGQKGQLPPPFLAHMDSKYIVVEPTGTRAILQ